MTSLLTSSRQVSSDTGYYIPLASLIGKIYAYNGTAGASTFSTAVWATANTGSPYTSSISSIGQGVLKDMGKTVVSSGRTFRKVQLVWYGSATAATFGVNGASGTAPDQDYLTGYIELGWEGAGIPAPVARMGP
jgi:hypothetical protein